MASLRSCLRLPVRRLWAQVSLIHRDLDKTNDTSGEAFTRSTENNDVSSSSYRRNAAKLQQLTTSTNSPRQQLSQHTTSCCSAHSRLTLSCSTTSAHHNEHCRQFDFICSTATNNIYLQEIYCFRLPVSPNARVSLTPHVKHAHKQLRLNYARL